MNSTTEVPTRTRFQQFMIDFGFRSKCHYAPMVFAYGKNYKGKDDGYACSTCEVEPCQWGLCKIN